MARLAVLTTAALAILAATPSAALADEEPGCPDGPGELGAARCPDGAPPRGPAIEINVLWPFFPGGLFDLKAVVPVVRREARALRGELIVGLHSDFGWRSVREGSPDGTVMPYGKVAILAGKLGYRQFFTRGLHADATVNLGWRQERDNPFDGATLDAFVGRLWLFAGWQADLTPRLYANARAGLGVHLFRTDRFGDHERRLAPAADLNLGFRL